MPKGGLGKGLGAIFGTDVDRAAAENAVKGSVRNAGDVSRETSKIRISLIEPNRSQPRTNFDEKGIGELADSIKKHGMIQPIVVKKNGDTYEIVVGERRWRAAKAAGLREVPVIVKDVSEQESAELALIENIQREDLGPVEEARAYRTLIEKYGMKQEELAEKVSKSRSAVTNSIRLLQLQDSVLELLENGKLTQGHARALLGLGSRSKREELAVIIAEKGLSVRETEALVKKYQSAGTPKKKKENGNDIYLSDISKKLTESLNTKVTVKSGTRGRGKIEIEYYNESELNRLLDHLR